MTGSPLWNIYNYPRKENGTHGVKPEYERWENFHSEHSHGEKYIQVYKDMRE